MEKRKQQLTIKRLIEESLEKFSDKPALSFYFQKPITYKELKRRIEAISTLLKDRGIRKGDKVAIIGENSPNWAIAYLGIVFMGAVVVPILPDFPREDILNVLKHSDSKLLFATKKHIEKIVNEECSNVKTIISLDDFKDETRFYKIESITDSIEDVLNKASTFLHDIGEKVGIFDETIKEDDLAAIIYTSGTTGLSKGVMLTHKNIVSNILSTRKVIEFNQSDRFLSILPMSHAYEGTLGFLMPLSVGATIYYLGGPPTPALLKKACSVVKPTIMTWVPLIMEKIYKKKVKSLLEKNVLTKTLSKVPGLKRAFYKKASKSLIDFLGGELRFIAFGGAPLSRELEKFMKTGGFPYVIGYGLTETSPLLTGERPEETRIGSCGYPIDGVEIKIVDPDPKTGIGEIFAKGPNIMKGYYKNKKLTEEVLFPDGWFKTGDRGYFDKDGFLYIKGRSKNMFLGPNGENIYPEAIEEKLLEFLVVQEALVIESKGDIVALIYLDPNYLEEKLEGKGEEEQKQIINNILEEIRVEVNKKLPSFSRIKRCYYQREPFSKTATQKIKRFLYYHPE